MIRTATLANGLQIVTEAMAETQSVALSFWVGTGARDEVGSEWGISHFLEHLLFKGTETRTALDIAQAIDAVGGDMNAFTTKELTSFYVRVLAEERDLALDILCDIMAAPSFDAKELEAERQVVLEEILMRGDEPADLVHDLFEEVAFADHPLGREILGDEAGITSLRSDDISQFFADHYRPQNMVFAAAGDLDHDEIVAALDTRFGARRGGVRPERAAPSFASGARRVVHRDTEQAHVVLGVPAPHRHSGDRYAAALLDVILGGGMSSRLFQEVREQRGLAYSVYSSFTPYDDAGLFSIYTGSAPGRVRASVDVILEQLALVAANGITADELARAQRNVRANSLLNLEDSGSRMSRIGRSLLQHGDVLSAVEVDARFRAVTVDDVSNLAHTLFAVEPALTAIGPLDDALRPAKRARKVA